MNAKRFAQKVFSPLALFRQLQRFYLKIIRRILWHRLDKFFLDAWRLPSASVGSVVLVDGFWDNPNHFFRLRLFLEGVPPQKRQQLVALLRTPEDRARHTLIALGFTRFFYLSDAPVTQDDRKASVEALAGIRHHRDFLELKLPGGMPPDIFYDTALKIAQHPRPPLDSPVWVECLADIYRLNRFYNKIFSSEQVDMVVMSHPWKNEFGAAVWEALSYGAICFYLNGMYEVMRIKRFDRQEDYFSPAETLTAKEFNELSQEVQSKIAIAGMAYLEDRSNEGTNTDINQVMAYRNIEKSRELTKRLSIQEGRPVVLVCCHAWYDFPHAFGMRNFVDFQDWLEAILGVAFLRDDVTWLIKPHPTESWYGGFFMSSLIENHPDHVHILPEDISVLATLEVASVVVTVHGTVAMEAVARGIPVLCADKSYYSDWGFSRTAVSREDFIACLKDIELLAVPTDDQKARAAAFAYLAIAPGDLNTGLLRLPADHVPPKLLFGRLNALMNFGEGILSQQGQLVSDWLNSETKSFSIFHKVKQIYASRNLT